MKVALIYSLLQFFSTLTIINLQAQITPTRTRINSRLKNNQSINKLKLICVNKCCRTNYKSFQINIKLMQQINSI